jgi:hypothetical protein
MKPESEQHSLLDDVLSETAPADFEHALLDGTLRAVRRRRRIRQGSRGLAAVGVFAAIAVAVWNALLPAPSVNLVPPTMHIVSSQPLPASMVVATKPDGAVVVTASPTTFVVVETGAIKDPFQEINDEQLLALAGGRPVALVRQGSHQAELLFLNPEDTNGFPVR